jgi:hypothetical protein
MSQSESRSESGSEIPVACALGEAERRARREELVSGLLRRVRERRELPDGYAFRFASEPGVIEELAAFVAFERACCAFLHFQIEAEPGEGPLWLSLTGPGDTKQFLRDAFVAPSDEAGCQAG